MHGNTLGVNIADIQEKDRVDVVLANPPFGGKERADDVPARLSKNEFVMTADAVRGMGDGNVEKGAQKMYDQMRELESRVV